MSTSEKSWKLPFPDWDLFGVFRPGKNQTQLHTVRCELPAVNSLSGRGGCFGLKDTGAPHVPVRAAISGWFQPRDAGVHDQVKRLKNDFAMDIETCLHCDGKQHSQEKSLSLY